MLPIYLPQCAAGTDTEIMSSCVPPAEKRKGACIDLEHTVETVVLVHKFFFSTSMFGIGFWRNGK